MLAQTAEAAAGGGAAAAGGAVGAGAGAAGAGAAGAGAGEGAEGAGGGTGSGVPMADGDPESQRAYDDAVARGVLPGPKGPKPVLGVERASGTSTGTDVDDAAAPASASASVGNGVRDDPTRTPTGPATPEDAWKWEGVPAGRRLIGKVEPGETRYYMDDDGHGPQIRWLPAAWPPGQGPPEQGPGS